ncbi:hypothetical protein FB107DRAFT_294221 [Schizophyllum commune]
MFDWLRKLYQDMSYVVARGADHTDAFQSTMGTLAGDSASPGLWNIYFSDISIPSFPDAVRLNGVGISPVEQADDVALLAKSLAALQVIVRAFVEWDIFFGPIPRLLERNIVDGVGIDFVDEYKYAGTIFFSTEKNIFERNYHSKEVKARGMTGAMFGAEDMVGTVPMSVGVKLYMMRIDPHPVFGCDVVLEVEDRLVDALQRVQQRFLRRLLGLNPSSICAASLHGSPISGHVLACYLPLEHHSYDRLHDASALASIQTKLMRPYLATMAPSHRKALTRLLLSDHILALEVLSRQARYRLHVEDEVHGLLDCRGRLDLISMRRALFEDMHRMNVRAPAFGGDNWGRSFLCWLAEHKRDDVRAAWAHYVHRVLGVFESVPIYVMDQCRLHNTTR